MELKNKEKRELLRDIKYQSAELRETGDVQSNSQVIYIFVYESESGRYMIYGIYIRYISYTVYLV